MTQKATDSSLRTEAVRTCSSTIPLYRWRVSAASPKDRRWSSKSPRARKARRRRTSGRFSYPPRQRLPGKTKTARAPRPGRFFSVDVPEEIHAQSVEAGDVVRLLRRVRDLVPVDEE